jgi:hypothetical protein
MDSNSIVTKCLNKVTKTIQHNILHNRETKPLKTLHNIIENRRTDEQKTWIHVKLYSKSLKIRTNEDKSRWSHTNETIIEQREGEEEKEEKDINFDLHETGGGWGWGSFWRAYFRWLWSVSWLQWI